jgi:D-alanyl-D-alanine carboxypeptidase
MNRLTATGVTVLAGAMATLGSAVPATAAPDQPRIGDVQQVVEQLADDPGVVGVIAEAYHDGKRIDRGTAGSRLIDGQGGGIPTESRYRAWSQTKFMTATVLLQLVDEGKLGLDDKLSDVLPIVAEQNLVERADEITVRQLLKHTSGIPDFAGEIDQFDTGEISPVDLLKVSRSKPREFAPGEESQYSNINYVLLGLIIERVTGDQFANVFEQRLFEPLDMERSYVPASPTENIKGPHGHGYYPDARGNLRDTDELNATFTGAAGAVVSDTEDLTTFFRAFNQGELLPPELQEVITERPEVTSDEAATCQVSKAAGAGPGSVSMTSTSADGHLQLAISVTISVPPDQISSIVAEASDEVLCPGEST